MNKELTRILHWLFCSKDCQLVSLWNICMQTVFYFYIIMRIILKIVCNDMKVLHIWISIKLNFLFAEWYCSWFHLIPVYLLSELKCMNEFLSQWIWSSLDFLILLQVSTKWSPLNSFNILLLVNFWIMV